VLTFAGLEMVPEWVQILTSEDPILAIIDKSFRDWQRNRGSPASTFARITPTKATFSL
jgi:hypothetical protein